MDSEIDLLQELAKATEPKAEYNAPPLTSSTVEHETLTVSTGVGSATDNGFTETETTDNDFLPPNTDDVEEISSNVINAEDLTDLIIEGADMVFQNFCPSLYTMSLSKNERKILAELMKAERQAKGTKKEVEYTEEMLNNQHLLADYESYLNTLPLKPNERKNLREPLAKVLAQTNFKTSPTNALIAIAVMVLAPRTVPIAKNKIF